MKKILFIISVLWASITWAQNPNTLPKFLREAASRTNIADTAALSTSIALWGDSYTQGVGGTGDSIYPTRLRNISNFFTYNRGVGGETSTQIMNRFLANPEIWKYPTIIWAGRNNYNDSATVVANVKRMVDSIRVRHNRYLVISIMNGGGEPSGSSVYIDVAKINAGFASQFGNHYVDLRTFMVNQYDPASAPDLTNFSQDIPPISKRNDSIHFNNRGQDLNAKYLYSRFNDLLPEEVLTSFNLKSMMNRLNINTNNDSIFFGPIQIRSGNIGFNSTSYSDRFTLGGGGSANTMAIYNTVDESTNYERLRIQALGVNGYNFTVQSGGTGSQRDLIFTTQNSGIRISGGVVTGAINVSRNLTGGNAANLGITGTHSPATGFSNGIAIYNTISTTSTGGYNGVIISPSFTSMGSGTHYLLNAGVNGSANGGGPHRSKFAIDTFGVIGLAPTYSTGGYDLLVRNQTTGRWESTSSTSGFVTSITGTTNQIIASSPIGAVTLSTPQNIHTGASPQFLNLGLGTPALSSYSLYIGGTPSVGGLYAAASVNAVAGVDYDLNRLSGSIVEPASGNAALYATTYINPPSITPGGGTLDNATSLYIPSAPSATVSGGNYSILVNAGTSRFNGPVQTTSGFQAAITTTTGDLTLTNAYHTVLVDATSAPVTITLPAAVDHSGRIYVIKKIDASANVITIQRSGSNLIDGATSQTISAQWASYTLQSNGQNYFVL